MSDVATSTPTLSRWSFQAALILLGGVIVIPTLLTFIFNSWSAPDAEAYVRMAFASVAGSTIAIVTVLGVLVSRLRERFSTVATFAVIALVVAFYSFYAINRAAAFLLGGLGQLP